MRRSICYCEPNIALAGETNTWSFIYTSATDLPKGTLIRFDMMADGREIDWELPTTNLNKDANVVYARLESGQTLPAKEIEVADSFNPQYEFVLPSKLKSGETFKVVVGSRKLEKNLLKKNGNKAQTFSQRRRPFLLYVDTSGKKQFEDPEIFSLDIKGGRLHHINAITPSFVCKNKRFDVITRFEDKFGNLTSNAPEETLVELSHEQLRENLSWKLFVPETGFISLPNLYFNEPGIYTIKLTNTHTKQVFRSPPIRCFNQNNVNIFWGLLHGESIRVDSTENIENCLRHFRDEKSHNFFATSCFENLDETPHDIWKLIAQNITDFDESDRFVTFLGFQWQGQSKKEGIRQIIYLKDNKPILRKKDAKYSSLKKIYKTFNPKEILSIPSFTMGEGTEYNFEEFDPEYEKVVEIYNSWGSSECLESEGNLRPIKGPAKKGVKEAREGSIVQALLKNRRFGFVAGGLDDRGVYSAFYEGDQEQYSPGLTAIMASDQTRASLWDALHHRRCYATTGERIILGLYLAGFPMGSETNTQEKHGLSINRHLSGFVAGTTDLESVELIRNGKTIKRFQPEGYHIDFEYDDMVPIAEVVIDAKDNKFPFVFYYLRVTQKDGHLAWSSPIWVDYNPAKPAKKNKAAKHGKKTASAPEEKKAKDFNSINALSELEDEG